MLSFLVSITNTRKKQGKRRLVAMPLCRLLFHLIRVLRSWTKILLMIIKVSQKNIRNRKEKIIISISWIFSVQLL